jgi:8-oxo-dGTP diphosphatase
MPQKLTYCPICSSKLSKREEGGRVRPSCDQCGYVHYHNPVPGVGMIIEMDGGIVLIQRGNPPHKDRWTLPSGFVEADESAEDAAVREAEEETGLKVEIIELMGINSFPEGPPVSGIMIFYRAKPMGGVLQAGDDAIDVNVFAPHEIPLLPFRTHREIMAEWLTKYHNGPPLEDEDQSDESDFSIRRAEYADINEVFALAAMIPANRNLSEEEQRAAIQRFRESPTVEIFVAYTKQSPSMIIGFIAMSVVRGLTEGRGLISDMAVLPTYRRKGVGAKLLEAVMRQAKHRNLSSLMVDTQRANDRVRAFYAACGFSTEKIMHLKIM